MRSNLTAELNWRQCGDDISGNTDLLLQVHACNHLAWVEIRHTSSCSYICRFSDDRSHHIQRHISVNNSSILWRRFYALQRPRRSSIMSRCIYVYIPFLSLFFKPSCIALYCKQIHITHRGRCGLRNYVWHFS